MKEKGRVAEHTTFRILVDRATTLLGSSKIDDALLELMGYDRHYLEVEQGLDLDKLPWWELIYLTVDEVRDMDDFRRFLPEALD